ncbi:hypothetical protein NLG97_g3428 [Lecanicillium saksenae]|uniref:Uncharacterized protein n=1 Tax=Lecanicillium saksenae TaxID=468837 RepID=A0ACC1QZV1_9HYPO|nr:hypothetical protein NLG97_g3428 [Lecanicillium saksenae]
MTAVLLGNAILNVMKLGLTVHDRPYSPLFGLCADAAPRDRALFYTLRTSAFNSLAGCFDRDFWSEGALQAAQSFPAVWHAGLAIAAECTSVATIGISAQDNEWRHVYAMQHYNKALQYLITVSNKTELSYTDKEAMLLSMILLTSLCCLWKDVDTALIHIGRGIQLFRQWRILDVALSPAMPVQLLPVRSLITLFLRFEMQYVRFFELATEPTYELQAATPETWTGSFTSIMEAYSEFLTISLAMRCTDPGATHSTFHPRLPIFAKFRGPFDNWKAKLARFVASRVMTDYEMQCILTLEFESAMTEIVFSVDGVDSDVRQLAYDSWLPMFEYMMTLAERLYEQTLKDTAHSPAFPLFSFSLSISDPLFFLLNCRDGRLRRRALALLRRWPQQDGLVQSEQRAARFEQLMLFEEGFGMVEEAQRPAYCQCIAGMFICGWHRVRWHTMMTTGSRTADTWLVTQWDWAQGYFKSGLIEKKTIEW